MPPLPPHISFDQTKAMAKALLKGDPDALAVMRQSFKGKIQEFVKGS